MKRVIHLTLLSLPLVTLPRFAYAYIDPGLISVLVQGFFALIFGSAAAYLLAPWQRIKALFGGKPVNPPTLDDGIAEPEDDPKEAPR